MVSPPRMFTAEAFSPTLDKMNEKRSPNQTKEKKPLNLIAKDGLLTISQRNLARNVFNEWIKI